MLNTLRRAAVWSGGETIDADDARDALLPSPIQDPATIQSWPKISRKALISHGIIDRVARHYLEQALQHTAGNKTRAAKLLGFGNPTTLTNWLKKHGVER